MRALGRLRRLHRLVAFASLALVFAGCGLDVPTDPDGTIDRVRGGVLRVGVSLNEPWTADVDAAQPSGIEPDLVRGFAEQLDAEVRWTAGGEESLIGDLGRGELDLVVGGLTVASPWASHAALTRPYVTVPGPGGEPEPHVMAAPMGENAFLLELERFLGEQEVQP